MNYTEALAQLNNHPRRKIWRQGVFLHTGNEIWSTFDKGTILFGDDTHTNWPFKPTSEDMSATDWELYPEPTPQNIANPMNLKDLNTLEKAILLITIIRKALHDGIKHYNKAGEELKTDLEILSCLVKEDNVTLMAPDENIPRNNPQENR